MMKIGRLYSNENFPIDIVNKLRYLGHDVLTSYQAGQANQGISDDDVLKFAHQQERVVITLNREDFIKLHRDGKKHSGIIICKDDRNYDAQASKVHELILDTTELKSRLFRVFKSNVKGCKTQIFIYKEINHA
ncbi:MAG: DUF5615 family PIN-like protein [Phormidium sp.]